MTPFNKTDIYVFLLLLGLRQKPQIGTFAQPLL